MFIIKKINIDLYLINSRKINIDLYLTNSRKINIIFFYYVYYKKKYDKININKCH